MLCSVKGEGQMRSYVSCRQYHLLSLEFEAPDQNRAGLTHADFLNLSCRMTDAEVEHMDASKPKDPTKPEMPKLLRTLSKGYQKSMTKTRDGFKKAFLTPRGARGPNKTDGEPAALAEATAEPEVLHLPLPASMRGRSLMRLQF